MEVKCKAHLNAANEKRQQTRSVLNRASLHLHKSVFINCQGRHKTPTSKYISNKEINNWFLELLKILQYGGPTNLCK